MRVRILMVAAAALLACAVPLLARNWPQWRGPNRDDVSDETGLLQSWPKDGPKLLWTFSDAGIGYSGPAVVGDHLYTMGGDNKKSFVYCLDLGTQEKTWSTEVGPFFPHGNGDGPRGTPTVDGDLVFALGGHGDLVCVEKDTGKKRWHVNLKTDLGGQMASGWGYSESVLVDGDKVICTPGGNKGTLAALNKDTGSVLWRSKELKDPAVYSSVIVADVDGVRQYIQLTGRGMAGVAADDGRLLWHSDQNAHGITVSTPIYHDHRVYASTSYGVGCGLVKLTKDGDKFEAEKVYDAKARRAMFNHHGGVVRVGAYVYGYSDGPGWTCQEFETGKVMWQSNKLGKGSVTYADGRLYCYTESGGTVAVVEATPDGWKEGGRFTLPKQSKLNRHRMHWTHPVVANGRLFLRDQEYLFCYDVKAHTTAGAR
ncbi:MAG TPA: PQQ-binding-like beta-propeller repeat protein [Gemmataceae bacterium]|nr:PQQ-binding-like beta-propeller repeat protein [Gemmataceae bacterium]